MPTLIAYPFITEEDSNFTPMYHARTLRNPQSLKTKNEGTPEFFTPILPSESELEALLNSYPVSIESKLQAILKNDQKEFIELQQACLTTREKKQASAYQFGKYLMRGTFLENKPLLKHLSMAVSDLVTTGNNKQTEEAEEVQTIRKINQEKFLESQKTILDKIKLLKENQAKLNKPSFSSFSLVRILQQCCCLSKEGMLWYTLDARIRQFECIQEKIGSLIFSSDEMLLSSKASHSNGIRHRLSFSQHEK